MDCDTRFIQKLDKNSDYMFEFGPNFFLFQNILFYSNGDLSACFINGHETFSF